MAYVVQETKVFESGAVINDVLLGDEQYVESPDYKKITVSGGSVTDAVVSNGGILYISSYNGTPKSLAKAQISGAQIYDGGLLSAVGSSAAELYDTVIYSGGSVQGGTQMLYHNLTIEAGGKFTPGGAAKFSGELSFCAGAFVGAAAAYTDENGVIYNFNYAGAVHFVGQTLSNTTVTAPYYFSSGCVVNDVMVNNAGYFHAYSGAVLNNVTLNGSAGAAYISKGATVNDLIINSGAQAYVRSSSLVSGAIINTGGCLRVSNGGIARDITVHSSGSALVLSRGSATNVVIKDGGYVRTYSSSFIGDVTVESGGWLRGGEQKAVISNANVASGGKLWTMVNNTIAGSKTNIVKGAWTGSKDIEAFAGGEVIDGVIYANGQTLEDNGGAFYFADGITVSNGVCDMYWYFDNATAKDVTITAHGIIMDAGTYARDITLTGTSGYIWVRGYNGDIAFGGAETNIAQGKIVYGKVGETTVSARIDEDLYITDGVAHGLFVASGDYIAKRIHLRDGMSAVAPVVSSGGTLTLSSGVTADAPVIKFGGSLILSNGAAASNTITSNAAVVRVLSGAVLEDTTAYGGSIRAQGGTVLGYTASGYAVVSVYDDGYLSGAVLDNNGATSMARVSVYNGGVASDVTLNAGAFVAASEGGFVKDVTLAESGTQLIISSGAVVAGNIEILQSGAKVVMTKGGTISGATLYSSDGCGFAFTIFDGNDEKTSVGRAQISIYDTVLSNGSALLRGSNVYASGIETDGRFVLQNGASVDDLIIGDGGYLDAYAHNNDIMVEGHTDVHANGVVVKSGGSVSLDYLAHATDVTAELGALVYVHDATATITNLSAVGAQVSATAGTITNMNIETRSAGSRVDITGTAVVSGGTATAEDVGYTRFYVGGSAKLYDYHVNDKANILLANGGEMIDTVLSGGSVIARGSKATVTGATVVSGYIYAQNGGTVSDVVIYDGKAEGGDRPNLGAGSGAIINNLIVSGGVASAHTSGTINGITVDNGFLRATSGATINDAVINSGGSADIFSNAELSVVGNGCNIRANGTAVVNATSNAVLHDLTVAEDATVNLEEGAILTGEKTNVAGTLNAIYEGAESAPVSATIDAVIVNGEVTGLGATATGWRLGVGDGIVVKDANVSVACRLYATGAAVIDGANIEKVSLSKAVVDTSQYAVVELYDTATIADAVITGEDAYLELYDSATVLGATVNAGGTITVNSGDVDLYNVVAKAGANVDLFETDVYAENFIFDFTGAESSDGIVNSLGSFADGSTFTVIGVSGAGEFTLGEGTLANISVKNEIFNQNIAAGSSVIDASVGLSYAFDGSTVTATEITVAEAAAAGSVATAENNAATWTENTTGGTSAIIADGMTSGEAWVVMDGFDGSATNIFGAGANEDFAGGTVNIAVDNGAIKNFAGGAGNGGTVKEVNVMLGEGASVGGGMFMAGGMGNVDGTVSLGIDGATVDGKFYAGAIANKNDVATGIGAIDFTIEDGTFNSDIYGGSVVRTQSGEAVTDTRHSVGTIDITINGGNATNNNFSLYAGGIATGSAEDKSVAAYTVGAIDLEINNGSWGGVAGGRGIFGGIFVGDESTSKLGVKASAGDVAITINGGSMGNVYGGGWAQKNGISTVENVNISVNGGTVGNIFGSGNHSTSGGETIVNGDVTISVGGGTISGAIYARGYFVNDKVLGNATVSISGETDLTCGIYGSGQEEIPEGKTTELFFGGYTGNVSGDIAGFDTITIVGNASVGFSGVVENQSWAFDISDRLDGSATSALANFTDKSFGAGDILMVNAADGQNIADGWSIASGITAADEAVFSFAINGTGSVELALGAQIADGEYAGWGFAIEDSVLKFKNLA